MFFAFELPFAAPAPIAVDPTVGQISIEAEKAFPSPPLPPPEPAQVQAAEQYFANERECQMVAGMLGMWTGTTLLHDLMIEHLGKRSGEFEEEERDREKRFAGDDVE
jgi:hypothetical protein